MVTTRLLLPLSLATALLAPACGGPPPSATKVAKKKTDEGDDEAKKAAEAEARAAEVAALADEFLAGMFKRGPVTATSMGVHDYDGQWPDASPKAREDTQTFVTSTLEKARAIKGELDPDARLELDLIINELELWQFSIDVTRSHANNPYSYVGTIGSGLDDLISRDFAPIEQRAASVAERLEGLPTYIDQAIANLGPPEQVKAPHAKVAVSQLDGVGTLISSEIVERTKEAPDAVKARIKAATPAALEAVDRLKVKIEKELLPKAAGEWRAGTQNFDRKLRLTLNTDLSADEVHKLATEEHARVRGRMAELSRELHPILFGEGALEKLIARASGDQDAQDGAVIHAVLEALAADHPTPENLRDACEENLERLSAFVRDNKLVPTDPKEVLEVIWTPPHARGYAIAGLASPGPLEDPKPGLPSFYLVQPVPKDWSKERTESFLREYNSFMLEILSIHEAIPGHFVQLYHGKREPSRLRRVLGNGAFVEGWAVYTERVMVEAGYAGAGPAEGATKPKGMSDGLWKVKNDEALRAKAIELHGLKFFLRTVTNAIIDHEIQAGDMTEEQAVKFMTERSFQEEGEAHGKWIRAQLVSAQLSTYFVGATAWFRLREQAKQRAEAAGEEFDLEAFNGEALSHGAPPVHRLPALMGWESDPADTPSGPASRGGSSRHATDRGSR